MITEKISSENSFIETGVLDAIKKIEATHRQLNAAIEILKDEAIRQLEHLPDGLLKGIPISVKECYAMKGKKITSGSKRMKPIECTEDAVVVKKLKEAGAVIVARGNTSEFLLGRETNNRIFGTTNNSINPLLTSGGSSGGDGALVGSGSVDVGIGTDIGGSCRYPALFNGAVGFKPASGQIDKTGIFPSAGNSFVETLNSPGIMSRSVHNVRLVYNVIGNKQLHANNDLSHVQLLTCDTFDVKVKDESINQAVNGSIDFFRKKSLLIKDVEIPDSGSHYKDFVTLMTAGFTNKIYEWSATEDGKQLSFFGELYNRVKGKPTLSDELFAMLIPFNLYNPSSSKLERTIQKIEEERKKYYDLFGKNGILIIPTAGILAPPHKKFIPQYNKPGVIEIITPVSFCNVYNLSCITIPAWKFQRDKTKNPPGVQLISAAGNEELLLNAAEQLERYLQS